MRVLLFFIAMLLMVGTAFAAPPVPPQKTQSLEILQKRIADEKAQQDKLSKQAKDAEKDIAAGKSKIVNLSAAIRKNEDAMRLLEMDIEKRALEEEILAAQLDRDRGSMASTVLGLARLRRVPPELLIIRPGAPLETAQTAMLLGNMLPALDQRAQKLARDIDTLHEIRAKLSSDRDNLLATKTKLEEQNKELAQMMARREKEFKSAHVQYRASAARAEQFASEAKSLADLVARIEQENQRVAAAQAESRQTESSRPSPPPAPRKKTSKGGKSNIKGLGNAIWPVSGRALARFGDPDEFGSALKGVRIGAPARSIVVTPLEGVVKYAGTFRNYGQLVIIEHDNGYHSLLAGLSRADVAIGQGLKAGEPVGYMPASSSQDGPLALYYELRHDGEAIDPSNLFSALRS